MSTKTSDSLIYPLNPNTKGMYWIKKKERLNYRHRYRTFQLSTHSREYVTSNHRYYAHLSRGVTHFVHDSQIRICVPDSPPHHLLLCTFLNSVSWSARMQLVAGSLSQFPSNPKYKFAHFCRYLFFWSFPFLFTIFFFHAFYFSKIQNPKMSKSSSLREGLTSHIHYNWRRFGSNLQILWVEFLLET
jgi:hypothetical protein